MAPLQVVVSGIVSIVVYSLIVAGVFKLFQMATSLSEIKDLLQDIKRNTQDLEFPDAAPHFKDPASPALAPVHSPGSLILAVAAESEPAAVDREI